MEQQEFDAFSVFFWENSVRVGEQTYSLGQATVDVLNYPAEEFSRLCDLTEAFGRAYDRLLDQRDKRMAEDVQSKFNAALDVISTLPPYRDLKLDAGSRTFLLDLREMPEEWDESMRSGSEADRMFRELGAKVVALPERVNNFRGQVALMLEFFFEDLPRRNSSEYGRAFDDYYRAMIEGGAREREEASPVQREYQRTYNRLKQQHQRRKKGDTEYNRQAAQAQDLRDAYARGALGEEDAIARLIAIK